MNTEKAASITPPVQGENLWVLAGSAFSSVSYVRIPDAWKGAYLTFSADGGKFYIAFSESASGNDSASKTATSTVSSNAFTAIGANNMEDIQDGSKLDVDMATADRHKLKTLIVLSDTGTGHLRIRRSSGPVAT